MNRGRWLLCGRQSEQSRATRNYPAADAERPHVTQCAINAGALVAQMEPPQMAQAGRLRRRRSRGEAAAPEGAPAPLSHPHHLVLLDSQRWGCAGCSWSSAGLEKGAQVPSPHLKSVSLKGKNQRFRHKLHCSPQTLLCPAEYGEDFIPKPSDELHWMNSGHCKSKGCCAPKKNWCSSPLCNLPAPHLELAGCPNLGSLVQHRLVSTISASSVPVRLSCLL